MPVSNEDFAARLSAVESTQDLHTRQIAEIHTAFVPDDLGNPGFHGHRNAHRKEIAKSQALDGIKMDVTKRVIQGGLALLCTLAGAGAMSYIAKLA